MKKVLSLILAVMMVLAVFTACGGSEGADGEVPTLVWYVPGDKQADTDLVSAELSKITAEKIGCNISIQFIDSGSFQERMNMNMAAGDKYDLAFVGYLNVFTEAASKGGLMALDDLLETTPDLVAAIPEYIMNYGLYDGTMYAIPNMQITASATAASFNKALVEKYNFDVNSIRSTHDIEPFLEAVKAGEDKIWPFRTNWGVSSFRSLDERTPEGGEFYNFINNGEQLYSAVIDRENKTYKATFGYEEGVGNTKMKAEKLHEYYKKGYIRDDVDAVLDDASELNAGKFGVWFNVFKPGMDGEMKASLGYETVSVRISPVSMGSATSTMIGIGANCRYPEKAIKFIELINTDVEAYNLVCFGIEGKHYNKIAENRIELVENSGYAPNASWKFGNQFNAYVHGIQEDDVWEQTRALNDEANEERIANPSLSSLGFTFDTTEIKSVVTKVTEVKNKYNTLRTGSKDPNTYWDKMVDELYAAGLQALLDEYQLQIDTFIQENPEKIATIKW